MPSNSFHFPGNRPIASWDHDQQAVGSRLTQSHYHLGGNDFDLGLEVRETKIHFPHRGRSVAIGLFMPRSPVHNVSKVNRIPRQAHGLDNLRQQLTGWAYERQPLLLFLGTGSFAAKEKLGVQVPGAKNDLAVWVEFGLAGRTCPDFSRSQLQRSSLEPSGKSNSGGSGISESSFSGNARIAATDGSRGESFRLP